MFNYFLKFTTIALIFPLVIIFQIKDCGHQNRNTNTKSGEATIKMGDLQKGQWGGEHISLDINLQGARVEYDCAHGNIDQKISPDNQGHFSATGTHVREHGGPVRKDEVPDTHPAQYEGQIKENTMTLTVTETDTKELVGTFTLVYGQKPHIVKCR
jgi:hypothetical protein